MRTVRVSESAAVAVEDYATEHGITKTEAASQLVLYGWKSRQDGEVEARQALRALAAMEHESRGYKYSVRQYAVEKGMRLDEAIVRLIRVGLGREGALARDRAKREAPSQSQSQSAPSAWAHLIEER